MRPEDAFGKVLRDLRVKSGLSQEKLALEANLDRTFISLLERGLRQPSLVTILEISKILKVPAAHLVELAEAEMKK
ncbi:helix-turn-helix domain-containing protein [Citrifermentans bremense]|uniref:HTH cro/C1-type domain-containing protein n=1 Tax=Citrifermentans bremense TaxID=60035 RepID=A0A6S6M352_9BACT|nr:helix-turn-helix transcriptional regulator [Citrifermentans bremense]